MSDDFVEIDSAMNMIKEDVIRDLYESVSKQNKTRFYQNILSNKHSFSEHGKD